MDGWEKCLAIITDTKTGESRLCTDMDWTADGTGDYMWGDGGNYSCDCNRALFFATANGEDDPDVSCGDERYHVCLIAHSGEIVYEDGPR